MIVKKKLTNSKLAKVIFLNCELKRKLNQFKNVQRFYNSENFLVNVKKNLN
jgi:hypothetical protein